MEISGIIEAMSERQTIVCDLRHAVVVDERGSNDEHVEYLMTLKLHQHQHQNHDQQQQCRCRRHQHHFHHL